MYPVIVNSNQRDEQRTMLSLDHTTTKGEETLVVTIGTIRPFPASSPLTHGNWPSLFNESYQPEKEPAVQ